MKYVIIAGAVILAIFLAVLSQIPLGIEPLTELFIENHTSLPKNVYLDKAYNFSFTIHNLEYQDAQYDYSINAYDADNNLLFPISGGTFYLAENASRTINTGYIFDKPFGRAKIEVKITKNLIGEPEFKRKLWWPDPNYPEEISVHFWVDEIIETRIIILPDSE